MPEQPDQDHAVAPTDAGALMHIGEVADRTGLSHRTIRYYEEMGLLRPSGRTEGGFRLYDDECVARLLLVKPMKPLGFQIDEIRDLLLALDTLESPSATAADREAAGDLVGRTRQSTLERLEELRTATTRAEEFSAMLAQVEDRHER